MMPQNPVCLVALTALLGALLQACPVAAAPPRLQAGSVSEPVVLDRCLNDGAWRQGPAASGFTQREPAAGAPATETTAGTRRSPACAPAATGRRSSRGPI